MADLRIVRRLWTDLNDGVALWAVGVFGTMPTFYLFMAFCLLPLTRALHPFQDTFLYWGNTIQLLSLPLLAVGQQIQGRAAEDRAQQDHLTLQQEFQEIRETHAEIKPLVALVPEIHALVAELHASRNQNLPSSE